MSHFLRLYIEERDIPVPHATMPNAPSRRTVCAKCGDRFSIGWGIFNHQLSSPCSPSAVNAGDVEGGLENGTGPVTISTYMEALAVRGTLGPNFLQQYAKWGPRGVSRAVTECSRFLRCSEVGSGSSRRHAQTFLDYTKSIGGRAHPLPKTVEGCWNVIEKVTFRTVVVTFHYVLIIECDILLISSDISVLHVTIC